MTMTNFGAAFGPSLFAPITTWAQTQRARLLAALPPKNELLLLAAMIGLLALWATSAAFFGYVAIIVPALILVPTIFTVLLFITWG